MKKLFVLSVIVSMISLLAGCTNLNEVVGPNGSNEQSVVNFKVDPKPAGELSKTLANVPTAPTILLVGQSGSPGWDTIPLVGLDTVKFSRTVKKGQSYEYVFHAVNPATIYEFNSGRVSFTAPTDKDSFSVAVTLPANVGLINATIRLKGTPVDGIASHIKMTWSQRGNGITPWVDSSEASLTPADTAVTLKGLMAVDYRLTLSYDFVVTITCPDGVYAYGVGTIDNVVPSSDHSLTIPLKMYDKNGVVIGLMVALEKRGQATILFTWL